jgi:hypothetical protein
LCNGSTAAFDVMAQTAERGEDDCRRGRIVSSRGAAPRWWNVPVVSWEEMYQRAIAAHIADGAPWPSRRPYGVPAEVVEQIRVVVNDLRVSEFDTFWLKKALADPGRRWLAARVLAEASGSDGDDFYSVETLTDAQRRRVLVESFPDTIFDALIRAAVLERDPSFDGYFVRPAVWIFGWQRTMEALLRYLANGTDAEKWGAVNALLHASAWRHYPVPPDAPMADQLVTLRDEEMLRQFVQTHDVALHQTIVRWLRPVDSYPPRLRDLARHAHEIARNDPDDFVRTRGHSVGRHAKTLISPLPPREDGKS